jgi:hypothetical protein
LQARQEPIFNVKLADKYYAQLQIVSRKLEHFLALQAGQQPIYNVKLVEKY